MIALAKAFRVVLGPWIEGQAKLNLEILEKELVPFTRRLNDDSSRRQAEAETHRPQETLII